MSIPIDFDYIKKQILAFEWLRKWFGRNLLPRLIFFIILVLIALFVWDYHHYTIAQHQARKLYPEILVNMMTINTYLEKWSDPSFITRLIDNPKNYLKEQRIAFVTENYDKFYTSLGNKDLDIQIKNFYLNIKRNVSKYETNDIKGLKDQGDYVLTKINFYFGCSDALSRPSVKKDHTYNIVSQDTVVSSSQLILYFHYRFK